MWNYAKNDVLIEGLQKLNGSCSIIQFANWATTDRASDFWDGLYEDVIKPLHKRDFEFLFHLGDVTKRHAFEVEEALDIMGDYRSHGRVTLVLDENEADRLYNKLTGPSLKTKEKYLFLFNTMNIDVLLITQTNFNNHKNLFYVKKHRTGPRRICRWFELVRDHSLITSAGI